MIVDHFSEKNLVSDKLLHLDKKRLRKAEEGSHEIDLFTSCTTSSQEEERSKEEKELQRSI